MDRFVEFSRASSHRRGRLIRSSDYPKTGYILTLLPHSATARWTCQAKEANCPRGSFRRLIVDDIQYSAATCPAPDSPPTAPSCRRAVDRSAAVSSGAPNQDLTTDCIGPAAPF